MPAFAQAPPPAVPVGTVDARAGADARRAAQRGARDCRSRASAGRKAEQVRARSGALPQLSATASYDRALASEFEGVFDTGPGTPCPPFTPNPPATLDARVTEIERALDCGAVGGGVFGSGGDSTDSGGLEDLPFGRKNTWRASLSFSQNLYSGGRIGAQKAGRVDRTRVRGSGADDGARAAAVRGHAGVLRRRAQRASRRDRRGDARPGRRDAEADAGRIRRRHAAGVRGASRPRVARQPDAGPDPAARESRRRAAAPEAAARPAGRLSDCSSPTRSATMPPRRRRSSPSGSSPSSGRCVLRTRRPCPCSRSAPRCPSEPPSPKRRRRSGCAKRR